MHGEIVNKCECSKQNKEEEAYYDGIGENSDMRSEEDGDRQG